jgi:hypothetical protein
MLTRIFSFNCHFMELLLILVLKLHRNFQCPIFGSSTIYLHMLLDLCDSIHCPPTVGIQAMFDSSAFTVYLCYLLEFEYWDATSFSMTHKLCYFSALHSLVLLTFCVSILEGNNSRTHKVPLKICWPHDLLG